MKHRFGPITLPLEHSSRWDKYDGTGSVRLTHQKDCGDFVLTELACCNAPCHGETCLFLSDLHWLGCNADVYVRIADVLNGLHADWLLFGGDACVFMDTMPGGIKWLESLKVNKGKLAVRGNREAQMWWRKIDFWRNLYDAAGFKLLVNESFDAGTFQFYGVDDFRYGEPAWNALPENQYCITMCHNPDGAAEYDGPLGNLVLCGHTHGGQFNFPIIGPLYTSSMYGRQFLNGFKKRDDGALMYVSTGIGESGFGFMHRRVRCPREVVLLKL